jgi:hypothetical protein
MASTLLRAHSPVNWSIQQVSTGGLNFPAARLQAQIYLGARPARRHGPRDLCWLDTGAPLSVVPFHVHHRRLNRQGIPAAAITWAGQPCDLGRIDIWLSTDHRPYFRGPFSLLAKFPRSDPPVDLIPVLLGLEFFLAHQAEFHMLLPPHQGMIAGLRLVDFLLRTPTPARRAVTTAKPPETEAYVTPFNYIL